MVTGAGVSSMWQVREVDKCLPLRVKCLMTIKNMYHEIDKLQTKDYSYKFQMVLMTQTFRNLQMYTITCTFTPINSLLFPMSTMASDSGICNVT